MKGDLPVPGLLENAVGVDDATALALENTVGVDGATALALENAVGVDGASALALELAAVRMLALPHRPKTHCNLPVVDRVTHFDWWWWLVVWLVGKECGELCLVELIRKEEATLEGFRGSFISEQCNESENVFRPGLHLQQY